MPILMQRQRNVFLKIKALTMNWGLYTKIWTSSLAQRLHFMFKQSILYQTFKIIKMDAHALCQNVALCSSISIITQVGQVCVT